MNYVRRATIALVTSILTFGGIVVMSAPADAMRDTNWPSMRDTNWPM